MRYRAQITTEVDHLAKGHRPTMMMEARQSSPKPSKRDCLPSSHPEGRAKSVIAVSDGGTGEDGDAIQHRSQKIPLGSSSGIGEQRSPQEHGAKIQPELPAHLSRLNEGKASSVIFLKPFPNPTTRRQKSALCLTSRHRLEPRSKTGQLNPTEARKREKPVSPRSPHTRG